MAANSTTRAANETISKLISGITANTATGRTVDHFFYEVTSSAAEQSCTALVHASAENLKELFVSPSFPDLLLKTMDASRTSSVQHLVLPDAAAPAPADATTSLLLFFTQPVVASVSKGGNLIKKPFEFHLHIKEERVGRALHSVDDTDDCSTDDDAMGTKIVLSFSSPSDSDAATLIQSATSAAASDYTAGITSSRSDAAAAAAEKKKSVIRANLSGTIILDPRPFGCTQVTFTASIEVQQGAKEVTEKVAARLLNHFIDVIPYLRTRFVRSDEVGEAILKHFEDVIVPTAVPPAAHEKDLFTKSLTVADASSGAWRRIPNTLKDSVSYHQLIEKSGASAIGKAVANVDIKAARVLAWLLCLMTDERVSSYADEEGSGGFRKIIEVPESRSTLYCALTSFGFGLDDRILPLWLAWEQQKDGGFLLAFAPMEKFPLRGHVKTMGAMIQQHARATKAVVGTMQGCYRIIPLAENVCQVTLVMQATLGGQIPIALLNLRVLSTLSLVKLIQSKYERDGKAVDTEMRAAFPRIPFISQVSNTIYRQELNVGKDRIFHVATY
jgi:hypothetical protein